jgi:hypothetical protein
MIARRSFFLHADAEKVGEGEGRRCHDEKPGYGDSFVYIIFTMASTPDNSSIGNGKKSVDFSVADSSAVDSEGGSTGGNNRRASGNLQKRRSSRGSFFTLKGMSFKR